jgi:formate hydrogenlyase subunit 4
MFNFLSNQTFVKFINDLFRDSNSKKTSFSRILAFILFIMVLWFHIEAIKIMVEKKEIDHALLLEDFAFISAIIMQKNYINRKNIEGAETTPPIEPNEEQS